MFTLQIESSQKYLTKNRWNTELSKPAVISALWGHAVDSSQRVEWVCLPHTHILYEPHPTTGVSLSFVMLHFSLRNFIHGVRCTNLEWAAWSFFIFIYGISRTLRVFHSFPTQNIPKLTTILTSTTLYDFCPFFNFIYVESDSVFSFKALTSLLNIISKWVTHVIALVMVHFYCIAFHCICIL